MSSTGPKERVPKAEKISPSETAPSPVEIGGQQLIQYGFEGLAACIFRHGE